MSNRGALNEYRNMKIPVDGNGDINQRNSRIREPRKVQVSSNVKNLVFMKNRQKDSCPKSYLNLMHEEEICWYNEGWSNADQIYRTQQMKKVENLKRMIKSSCAHTTSLINLRKNNSDIFKRSEEFTEVIDDKEDNDLVKISQNIISGNFKREWIISNSSRNDSYDTPANILVNGRKSFNNFNRNIEKINDDITKKLLQIKSSRLERDQRNFINKLKSSKIRISAI